MSKQTPKTANREKVTRQEFAGIAAVLLAVFIFLLPILLGWHGIFIDDIRQHNYPNQVFQARYLKQGIIPLWDPHTFAGGLVFYTRVEDFAFYPVQWLFGFLGRIKPDFRSLRELVIIPIVGHFLWAALGAWILGRWGLGLGRVGAAALALTFTFSTSMIAGMLNHPMTLSLAWHPWLAAAVLVFYRRRTPGWLIFGAFVMAFSGPPYPNFAIFGYFLTIFLSGLVVLRCWIREGTRPALALGGGLAVMGAIGLVLAAPFWLATLDGYRYIAATFKVDYHFLTSGPRSVPWRWLASIFIPELFASTNFSFYWGPAKDYQIYWNEGFITRGMLLWLPAVLAVWAALKSAARRAAGRKKILTKTKKTEPCFINPRVEAGKSKARKPDGESSLIFWTWAGLGITVFALLMMLGRFSPVYGFFYRLGTPFRVPYATRWHTVLTMGLAILSGIGVHRLWAGAENMRIKRQVPVYLLLVTLVMVTAVGFPIGYWRKLADYGWLLRAPGFYWLVCVLLLAGFSIKLKPRQTARIIVILALADLLRSAGLNAYRPIGLTGAPEQNYAARPMDLLESDAYRPMGFTWAPEQDYATRPEETSLFQFFEYAARFDVDPMWRTGYSRVFCDNGALIHGGYSLLGVGVKPMVPRMYHTLAEICEGMPNETVLKDPTLTFVKNMSTAYWWYKKPDPPSTEWEYVTESPGRDLFLFRIPGALPRVYTLDRWEAAVEEESRRGLIHRDLREAVLLDADDRLAKTFDPQLEGPVRGAAPTDHFDALQRKNPIRRVDFSHPHVVEVDVKVEAPAMLVITDVWHPAWRATDNGSLIPIHRVNHLQRGVWLEMGDHRIRMVFRPTFLATGRWFSLIGLASGLAMFLGLRGRRTRNSTGGRDRFNRPAPMQA